MEIIIWFVVIAFLLVLPIAIIVMVAGSVEKKKAWKLLEDPNPSPSEIRKTIKKLSSYSGVKDDERRLLIDKLGQKLG